MATWHDILKFHGIGADEIVHDVRVSCPEVTGADLYGGSFDVTRGQTTVDGDVFVGVRRLESDPPSVFKKANQGVGASNGTYARTDYRLAMAGACIRVDKDLVNINPERGAAYMKAEAVRVMEDVIRRMGKQFFYGHGTDATAGGAEEDGFQGLEGLVDSSQTTSAGGTVSGTSTLTSAYLVRFSPHDGVSWLFGKDGSLEVTDIEPVTEFTTTDNVTRSMTWLQQSIRLYPGLAVQSQYSIGRVANISTSTSTTAGSVSTTAFTDEHLMIALSKMKERPDAIFMTRKAGILLGASRTNTVTFKSASLRVAPISMPSEAYGVPILYTDSLIDTEAVVS